MIGAISAMFIVAVFGACPGSGVAAPAAADGRTGYVRQAAADRPGEEFVHVGVTPGPRGLAYHAYERTYRGLPVVGGDFVVVTNASGAVMGDPLAAQRPIRVNVTPVLTPARAKRIARAELAKATAVSRPDLVVFSPDREQTLAYQAIVTGRSAQGRPSRLHVIVDARSGSVLGTWDEVMAGTSDGFYYHGVTIDTERTASGYAMSDPARRGLFCGIQGNGAVAGPDDLWGGGSGTDLETACGDAYYVAQQEWNMLRDWLGRDGFDGQGRGFPLFVGLDAVNSYWNGHTVNIGRTKDAQRQLSVLDIVAHEFGHSVFQYTPGGFDGYAETYALNEANGDIFGALTEHYADHPDDPPDYLFAERADAFGRGPERVMYDPSAGPRDEPNCWSTRIPDTEVHDAAGPADHWFYLVAEGSAPGGGKPASPVCTGGPASVTGVGIETAGKIWMTALLQKTSFWEYADARVATLNAVGQLYPGDCGKFDAVKGAWDAVSVPPQPGEPGRPAECGTPAGDFSIAVSPSSATVDPGGTVTATVSTRTVSGEPQQVSLAARNLPAGVTARFEPPSVTSGAQSTMTLTATASAPAGSHPVTIAGTGGTAARSAAFALTVGQAAPGGCTGFETRKTGALASGASAYAAFESEASGTHRACLDGPAGADFDLYLQKWDGTSWTTVARATTPAADEELAYSGAAGSYRYRIRSYRGAGDYVLGYDAP
ncbi:M4 family metallopeptidase [Spirillospora sp. NPDC049024]